MAHPPSVEHENKVLTCSYLLDLTPIDNYYQCYEEYDEDDDDNTIITSNLKENKCENLGRIAQGFIKQNLRVVNKNPGGLGVEPMRAPKQKGEQEFPLC